MSRPLGRYGHGTLLAILLAGSACSHDPRLRLAEVTAEREPVEIAGVPVQARTSHHSGAASLWMALEASGVAADYDALLERLPATRPESAFQDALRAAAHQRGRVTYRLPADPAAVVAEIAAGRPVLAFLDEATPAAPAPRYALMIGFDPTRNRMVLRSGAETREVQPASTWLRSWDAGERWAIVLLRPGEWPATTDSEALLGALMDFEASADAVDAGFAWQAATERWPDEPLAWMGVGTAAYRQGEWLRAREAYSRVVAADPGNASARFNLALVWVKEGDPCEGLRVLGAPPREASGLAAIFVQLQRRLQQECPDP